jgi:hypothetical protein
MRARTIADPRPRLHISPQKSRWVLRGAGIVFPPEFDVAGRKVLRDRICSERFSVHRGGLSPFVGCKMSRKFRFWKVIGVPIPARWSQFRP